MADLPVRVRLSPESERYLETLERSTKREVVFAALLRVFGRRGAFVAGAISKDMLSGQRLERRTGSLARSIGSQPEMIGGRPGVRVGIFRGPALQYAGVQEFGTQGENPESPYPTIKPRNAKALAMPIGKALTPAGVARYPSPRQYPEELQFVPFKGHENLLGGLYPKTALERERSRARRAKRPMTLKNAKAAYLLFRELDIEPQAFLRDGMLNELPRLAEDIGEELVRLVKGVA